MSLRSGAGIDTRDKLGMTPLLYAVLRDDSDSVAALLRSGADPNLAQRDDATATPSWHAAENFGLTDIAALLRQAGAVLL